MKRILCILSCIFLQFCVMAQKQSAVKLSGHIEDADTKELLSEAVVTIKELDTSITTDEKGDFVFDALMPGTYNIIITHVDCEPYQKLIQLSKDMHIDVFMPHTRGVLGEVVVEAQKGVQNTGFKKELSGTALQETRGLSLANALSRLNGITMLQTGSTIAKPVIHGLHSSRILMINNGVRQEGQQWGNEHAPEIDPFIANKLTVIKGVDELRYGSDAIAGVILVEPKALRKTPGYDAEINAGYFMNNRQYVVSGIWEQQFKSLPGFTYRLQGTYKKGANVLTPDYRLNNTGSDEKNFSFTAGWQKRRFSTELFYSHFDTELGIFIGSHADTYQDLLSRAEADKPEDVFLGQNTYKIGRPYQDVKHDLIKSKTVAWLGENKFSLMVARQQNLRKEYDVVINSHNNAPQLNLNVTTYTEDLSWDHPKKNGFEGTAGLAAMQQLNRYRGRYFIPNYDAYTFGGYYIEKWSHHQWELQGGLRYDYKMINTIRIKVNKDTIDHDFDYSTLAGSFNAVYKASDRWKTNVNLSLASRAPYVNELLSDGIHHGTGFYEKGDINLKPEKSFNLSAGINYDQPDQRFSAELLLYANLINDFIYQQPVADRQVVTISGVKFLVEYRQTNAFLAGADASIKYKILPTLQWNSRFSFLNARDTKLDDWLIWMPANRFNNELVYNFKDGNRFSDSYFSINLESVLKQRHVPDDGVVKQDFKAAPAGYNVLNANLFTTIQLSKMPVTIGVTVSNLLNTVYRDYLNRMRYFTDEMGRNIGFHLTIPINHIARN